ncbi:uncharacterized protein BO96DRAFT_404121 [Aspergillus niger CBS 101883]|uniref:Uncharacterized protein n=2 Tax=Aspergillus niger TaxID=5061 RepID=A2Q7Y6_ASPNC|nr:uncharacterized protein BO96DRAFT_404121 [Aspergillus niger CBS 101883]XP_059603114.1 hypothetical protein An01g02390 [Aspergillus niger]PYH51404.1 hypothetical protein BO96DRAFT_404121 [Aspergillus niger CBS 101883]CAK43609.1 hypothetical protein An01g02390 [Aspergillus niger]
MAFISGHIRVHLLTYSGKLDDEFPISLVDYYPERAELPRVGTPESVANVSKPKSTQVADFSVIGKELYRYRKVSRGGGGQKSGNKEKKKEACQSVKKSDAAAPCALCSQCRKVMESLEDDGLHTPEQIGNPEEENKKRAQAKRYFVVVRLGGSLTGFHNIPNRDQWDFGLILCSLRSMEARDIVIESPKQPMWLPRIPLTEAPGFGAPMIG